MARGILPRFETTVLRGRSPTDNTQVPAAATLEFYRQGATVASDVTIQPGVPPGIVPVHYSGQIEIGDTLRVGTSATNLTVVHVASTTEIHVNLDGPLPLLLSAGTRLWIASPRPTAFADPTGTSSLGASILTDAITGRASAYLSLDRFDFEVVIPGEPPRHYLDQAAAWGRSDQVWHDLRDFNGDLAAAVALLPDAGGVVYVPRGTWLMSAGVVVDRPNVTILGEGPASVLGPAAVNAFDLLTVTASRFRLKSLMLDGGATVYSATGKCCVVVSGSGGSGNDAHLEDVRITGAPRHGLWVKDSLGFSAERCQFDGNRGSGARLEAVTLECGSAGFTGCTFGQNDRRGLEAHRAHATRVLGGAFDGNRSGVAEFEGNALEFTECRAAQILSSSFRNAATTTRATNFVALSQCLSPQVDGCQFEGGADEPRRPVQGVVFDRSPGARLSNCHGKQLTSYLARFQQDSSDSVETCNLESEALASGTIVRIRADTDRMVMMSRRTLSLPVVAMTGERPASPTPGTMVWLNGELHVWTGATGWKRGQLGS